MIKTTCESLLLAVTSKSIEWSNRMPWKHDSMKLSGLIREQLIHDNLNIEV